MGSAADLRTKLAELAESQWGLLTTAQAAAVSVGAKQLQRLTDQGILFRLRHGVYRLTGVPDSPTEPIRVEWLALQPARTAGNRIGDEVPFGIVSHRSAADLQGLGDLDADYLEFTVPTRRGTRSADVRFHRAVLTSADWTLVDGLPVTTPVRTIADLAGTRTDGGHLASVVRDALLRGTSVDGIADALRPYAHRYGAPFDNGSALINHFIEQAGVPESSLALTAPSLQPLVEAAASQALNQLLHGQHNTHFTTAMASQPAPEGIIAALRRQQLAPSGKPTEAIRQALARLIETPEWRNMLMHISTQLQPITASAQERVIKQVQEAISEALIDAAVPIPEPDRDALGPGGIPDQFNTSTPPIPEPEQ